MNAPKHKPFEPKTGYERGFWALFVAQLEAVFTNNLFTLLTIFYLARFAYSTDPEAPTSESADRVAPIAALLSSLPFLVFPGMFGAFSDRFSKQQIAVFTRYGEVVGIALAFGALWVGDPYLIWGVVVLMAMNSALFSPAKYGILPEIVPDNQLSWANGLIQVGTIVPILLATLCAGPLRELLGQDVYWAMLPLFGAAFVGLLAARRVTRPPVANPARIITANPWQGLSRYIRFFFSDKRVFVSFAGYVFFWFVAYFVVNTVFRVGLITFNLTDSQISVVIACLGAGAGVGSVAAGYLSREKIEMGLVPLGLLGTGFCAGLLAFPGITFGGLAVSVGTMGVFAGLFSVPLIATLQQRAPREMKGGVMATVNMMTFFGIGGAAALFLILRRWDVTTRELFLLTSVLTFAFCAFVCVLQPVFILRMVLWVVCGTVYRVRTLGHENMPKRGGALLVANHTSFLDALMLLASTDRHIRFIMAKQYYDVFWIRPIAKLMGVIPISRSEGPRGVMQSLRKASEAIQSGSIVCIFPEGQITRTGQLLPFRKGYQRIMEGVNAPIVPVHLDELWGSIFSYKGGRFLFKLPDTVPYTLTVTYGTPAPGDTSAAELRRTIQELGTEAYAHRKLAEVILHRAFIKTARRHPFRFAVADERSGQLSYFKLLTGSIILTRKLKAILGQEDKVGILLPPGIGCTLVNIALQFMGRVPVNMNYTASREALESAAEQCGMKQVITAHAFLEKQPVHVPGEAVYVDDILPTVTKKDRIKGMLAAVFKSIRSLELEFGGSAERDADDLATIIFSSGSEGAPKGVMLTQYNISSNIDCSLQIFPHTNRDRVVGVLPIFHSFGFTTTLWLPLTRGLGAIFHPSPLEPRQIGKLVQKYQGKMLFATSTFLQGFIRRCSPQHLGSLEFVICGAEKMAPRVRDAFKDKFGVEPLEGYGTTECAPIVSLNLPEFRARGFFQRGTKRGSVGHPLPGISVKAIDVDTGNEVGENQTGMLCVKGPNIMKGYLGMPEQTAAVLQDGWYKTGDIVTIDEEGFITITDRLARFSKIAGEMVSHTQVEEELHELMGTTERMLAVTSVPDESKGERLVVLHMLDNGEFDDLVSKLDELPLPKIAVPKASAFYNVEEIPVLGTGKIDIKALKRLAQQLYIG